MLQEGKQFVLVTEFYETSLSQYLKQNSYKQKILIFHKLLKAVADWHSKKFFHLDLKPANIFVVDDEPVLIDFGLSYAPSCKIHKQLPINDPLLDKNKEVTLSAFQNTGAYAPRLDVF